MKASPTISIIIPTFNEESNIKRCLDSIFRQNYPTDKLEVLVVDDNSTDDTVKIAKRYKTKIIRHNNRHGEIGKMIGFKRARGEYAIYLDADIELRGKKWFHKMLKPLLENKDIIGSFTKKYNKKDFPSLERYLNFDPLQRDSIYQFFSPSIEGVIKNKKRDYFILQYKEGKIPPAGRCMYRRSKIVSLFSDYKMFLELDFLVLLTRKGFNKFAYVPNAGLYHHHVSNLRELLRKRKYNLEKVYLARDKRHYKWFDLKKPKDIVKIFFWVIYANLIIPSILVGIHKTIKHRDFSGMYEPLVNLLVTDYLIYNLIRNGRLFALFE